MQGTLVILVQQASLLRDTETFGKMDPVARFQYQGQLYKTMEKKNAGKSPVWNQKICIRVNTKE